MVAAGGDAEMVEVELDEEAEAYEEEAEEAAKAGAAKAEAAEEEAEPDAADEVAVEEEAGEPEGATEEAAAAPAVEEEEEEEGDEPEDAAASVRHDVGLSATDATPDVLVSAASGAVSSLSRGAFQHLRSAVRADTGAKAGRYLFEVKVLEHDSRTENELRVGFSTARSSLFLGDGSAENVCFSSEGTYFVSDPGQSTPFEKARACRPMAPQKVIGVLLNLNVGSPNANTVSIFLDGQRAGKPQPIPAHLRGRALFPALTFRNLTLAVNFGRKGVQLKPLPFRCRLFAEIAEAHHEWAGHQQPQDGSLEVVVPVGLPDQGIFDYVDRFIEEHPGFVELSDRKVAEWCRKSGLSPKGSPSPSDSRDRPDFNFGLPQLDDRSWRETLLMLAQLAGRSCIVPEVRSALLKPERKELLAKFPPTTKKVAAVLVGEPSKPFKDWVHSKIRADYEAKKALVEKRKDIAEASGEELPASELEPPPEPELGEAVWFMPRTGVPDLSEKAIAGAYAHFSLPDGDEGFDEVRYEWLNKDAAEDHLQKHLSELKATLLVDGLTPGPWFQEKWQGWRKLRQELRTNFSKHKASGNEDVSLSDVALAGLTDIHDCDGKGTPLYCGFKYEDWLLLSWRYELHLLVHGFTVDVEDPDRQGIPVDHVPHYFSLYYGVKYDPKGKLGVDNLAALVKLLKVPMELVERKQGRKVLQSQLGKETCVEDFVKGIETYRRDRCRRVEAGDESAKLVFPKPVPKPPATPSPAKAKAPAGKAGPAKAKAKPGMARPVLPAKAVPPKAPVAKSPLPAGMVAVKRPLPGDAASEAAAAKRPKPAEAGAPAVPTPRGAAIVKRVGATSSVPLVPVAYRAPAQVGLVKRPGSIGKAPVAKRKP